MDQFKENFKKIVGGEKNRGGFFDLPKVKICRDPEHLPPSFLNIPPGKGYRHICPSCGRVQVVIPPQITY